MARFRVRFGFIVLVLSSIILGGILRTNLETSVSNGSRVTTVEDVKQTALTAAELLLQQAISPEPDQLTWPVAKSPSKNITIDYDFQMIMTDETLGQVGDETVACIAVGDADNDGDNDIVLGTEPKGLVVLYENIATNQSIQFNSSVIANFTSQYGAIAWVTDIVIADLEGTGNNSILVATGYYTVGYLGDIFRIDKSINGWVQSETLNGLSNPVIGGVYSLAVGILGQDSQPTVVVGEGVSKMLDNSNVTIYTKTQDEWNATQVAVTNQSRVKVCVGDYTSTFDGNEIIYCTYDDNSTLGYVAIESGFYSHHIIDRYLIKNGDPPPYTRFMSVDIGDFEGDGSTELAVAIDGDGTDQDKIIFYKQSSNVTIIDGLELGIGDSGLAFNDFDNDGKDEVVYCYTNSTLFPDTHLMVYDWNGADTQFIFIETTIETYVSALKMGNVDMDDDIEFLYGTDGNGWLKMWDHPNGANYSFGNLAFNVSFTQLKPWIYEGDVLPFTVTLQHVEGGVSIYGINLTPILPEYIEYLGPSPWINELTPGSKQTISFNLRPMTFGQFSVGIRMNSSLPKRFESFEVNLHVLPRFPLQTHIGQSLLEFALYTNNETLLEAASMVGNWLDSVGISVGTYRAWNTDPNSTATLMPGYILSTTRTGKFFLNLYTATGNSKFRVAALDAANFLADPDEGNFTLVTGTGITWGLHKNGIAETAEVGEFLMEIKELGVGDFTEIITGIEYYFLTIANYGVETINWFESPGLTQAVGQFFAMKKNSGKMTAEQAGNWIVNKIDSDLSWYNSLIPSIRPEDPYDYHTGIGLVGVGQFLIYLEDKVDNSYLNHVVQIATRILNTAYTTEKGINWYEPAWTTNVTKLVHSVNLNFGSAGVTSFLINTYNLTENSIYLTFAIGASQWINASLSFIGIVTNTMNSTSEALADIIISMTDILFIIEPPIPATTPTTLTTTLTTPTTALTTPTTTLTSKSGSFPGFSITILFICTIVFFKNRKRKDSS